MHPLIICKIYCPTTFKILLKQIRHKKECQYTTKREGSKEGLTISSISIYREECYAIEKERDAAYALYRKKVFKWLLSFAKKYRKQYIIIFSCFVMENMIQAGIIMYFQLLETELFIKRHTLINVILILGIYICVFVSKIREKITRKVPEKIKNGMILEYYEKLHANERYYRENATSKCLSIIATEIDALQSFYGKIIVSYGSNIIKLMLSLLGMLLLFPALTIIYVIILMGFAGGIIGLN